MLDEPEISNGRSLCAAAFSVTPGADHACAIMLRPCKAVFKTRFDSTVNPRSADSVSNISAPAETVMLWFICPNESCRSATARCATSNCTPSRTSRLKPAFSTVITYLPGVRNRTVYVPSSLDLLPYTSPFSTLRTTTLASATPALAGSVMRPLSEARNS